MHQIPKNFASVQDSLKLIEQDAQKERLEKYYQNKLQEELSKAKMNFLKEL